MISDFDLEAWVIVGTLERPSKVKIAELLPLKPYWDSDEPGDAGLVDTP